MFPLYQTVCPPSARIPHYPVACLLLYVNHTLDWSQDRVHDLRLNLTPSVNIILYPGQILYLDQHLNLNLILQLDLNYNLNLNLNLDLSYNLCLPLILYVNLN